MSNETNDAVVLRLMTVHRKPVSREGFRWWTQVENGRLELEYRCELLKLGDGDAPDTVFEMTVRAGYWEPGDGKEAGEEAVVPFLREGAEGIIRTPKEGEFEKWLKTGRDHRAFPVFRDGVPVKGLGWVGFDAVPLEACEAFIPVDKGWKVTVPGDRWRLAKVTGTATPKTRTWRSAAGVERKNVGVAYVMGFDPAWCEAPVRYHGLPMRKAQIKTRGQRDKHAGAGVPEWLP